METSVAQDQLTREESASEPNDVLGTPAEAEPQSVPAEAEASGDAEPVQEPDLAAGASPAEPGIAQPDSAQPDSAPPAPESEITDDALRGLLEAIIYTTDEPIKLQELALGLQLPQQRVEALVTQMIAEMSQASRGMIIREIAGGYMMTTKPEHHEQINVFIKSRKQSVKLSLAALETLAVIAYKQPVTVPEINEIRGVQGSGVLKTLLERKFITTAGRKSVIGKPMLYKTTREFLLSFGLKDLAELPTLKEFEDLKRLALDEPVDAAPIHEPAAPAREAAAPIHEPAPPVDEAVAPSEQPVEPIADEAVTEIAPAVSAAWVEAEVVEAPAVAEEAPAISEEAVAAEAPPSSAEPSNG